MSRELISI